MKHIIVQQGTPEWDALRIGRPTASNFNRIITPKKLEPSAEADKYLNEILAEWLLGMKLDFGNSGQYAIRGTAMEAEARAFYEFENDVQVTPGGFVMRDDEKAGGSPDGLVGDDGGVELKCPGIHTHIGYMRNPAKLVADYNFQIQGYLYLTERSWWDVQSYLPGLPAVLQRVPRDERFIAALDAGLGAFVGVLDQLKEQFAQFKALENKVAA